jgi:hypothetical protein
LDESDGFRRILSGFNHRCRNSLNGIKIGLYLFRRQMEGQPPACWNELERTYQELERLFDWLHLIYRPLTLGLVRSGLGRLIDERLPSWRSWFALSGAFLEVSPPPKDEPGEFDPMHLGMALDALLAWRVQVVDPIGPAQLSWRVQGGFFELSWNESSCTTPDGADGSAEADRDARTASGVGSLALPLLSRIVSAHGGSVGSTSDPAFTLMARWPQFQCGARGGSRAAAGT